MQPYQPNKLVVPELNYPLVAGLNQVDTVILKSIVVTVVDAAIERMKSDQVE